MCVAGGETPMTNSDQLGLPRLSAIAPGAPLGLPGATCGRPGALAVLMPGPIAARAGSDDDARSGRRPAARDAALSSPVPTIARLSRSGSQYRRVRLLSGHDQPTGWRFPTFHSRIVPSVSVVTRVLPSRPATL